MNSENGSFTTLSSFQSFYLPGSVDVHDKQLEDWNLKPPPLYLWSRIDWTARHTAIAQEHGHICKEQLEMCLEGSNAENYLMDEKHDRYWDYTGLPPPGDTCSILDDGAEESYETKLEGTEATVSNKLDEGPFPSDKNGEGWKNDYIKKQSPINVMNGMQFVGRSETETQRTCYGEIHPETEDMCIDMEISSPINSPVNRTELRSLLEDKPSDVLDDNGEGWKNDYINKQSPINLNGMQFVGRSETEIQRTCDREIYSQTEDMCIDMEITSPINSPVNHTELRRLWEDKPSDVLETSGMETTPGCDMMFDLEEGEIRASLLTDMGNRHGSSSGTNLGISCLSNLENPF